MAKRPSQPPALHDGVKIIRKRRIKAENNRDTVSLILRIIVLAAAAWVLFGKIFMLCQASGNSMFPAIKDGDVLVGYRLEDAYAKNDIVVYVQGGKRRVGRIIARENDTIYMDDSGSLSVNGSYQSGEILYPTYAREDGTIEYPYTVPEGCVFILGDYRTQAEDSRDLGPVALSDVEAKVITMLRRRSL